MKVFSFATEKRILSAISTAVIIILWKAASIYIDTDIILPAPETVVLRLLAIMSAGQFWAAVGATVLRTVYGLLISFVLGFTAGIACGINERVDAVFAPVVSAARTIPVMSIILLAMIWFKTDTVPVFVCVLMIFPIITTNVKQGVKNVDRRLLEFGAVYGLSRFDKLKEITIPSIVPFVLAGLRSSIGVGWKVVIAAEVLSQPVKAIGTGLQFSQMNLETAEVMAWTLVALVLSGVSEMLLDLIIKKKRWEVSNG